MLFFYMLFTPCVDWKLESHYLKYRGIKAMDSSKKKDVFSISKHSNKEWCANIDLVYCYHFLLQSIHWESDVSGQWHYSSAMVIVIAWP